MLTAEHLSDLSDVNRAVARDLTSYQSGLTTRPFPLKYFVKPQAHGMWPPTVKSGAPGGGQQQFNQQATEKLDRIV